MNVGLPGTGLGGIFYLFCALVMLAVELVRLARGKGDKELLRIAAIQSAMAVGMMLAVVATLWAAFMVDGLFAAAGYDGGNRFAIVRHTKPIVITLIILAAMLGSLRIFGVVLNRRKETE